MKLKNTIKSLLSLRPILWLYQCLFKKGPYIILYHGISEVAFEKDSSNAIDKAVFEQQIAYLKKYFVNIPLSRLAEARDTGKPLPPNGITITFDDGYENNYTCAAPILLRNGFTATIFICPKYVEMAQAGMKIVFWWDILDYIINDANVADFISIFEKHSVNLTRHSDLQNLKKEISALLKTIPAEKSNAIVNEMKGKFEKEIAIRIFPSIMNWKQIKELRGSGFEFGAHTMSHTTASKLIQDKYQEEFIESKRNIEDHLGTKVCFFAFPYGERIHYSRETIDFLKASGYKKAFLVLASNDLEEVDPFCFNRTAVVKGDSFQMFKLKASGLYEDILTLRNKLFKIFRYN